METRGRSGCASVSRGTDEQIAMQDAVARAAQRAQDIVNDLVSEVGDLREQVATLRKEVGRVRAAADTPAAVVALRQRIVRAAGDRLILNTTTLDRRLRSLLQETDGDAAHVELVVRWTMAQVADGRRWRGPSPEEFWYTSDRQGVPAGAWVYRLWEYDLALTERDESPSRLVESIGYWLDLWGDSLAAAEEAGVLQAQKMLALLWKRNPDAS